MRAWRQTFHRSRISTAAMKTYREGHERQEVTALTTICHRVRNSILIVAIRAFLWPASSARINVETTSSVAGTKILFSTLPTPDVYAVDKSITALVPPRRSTNGPRAGRPDQASITASRLGALCVAVSGSFTSASLSTTATCLQRGSSRVFAVTSLADAGTDATFSGRGTWSEEATPLQRVHRKSCPTCQPPLGETDYCFMWTAPCPKSHASLC